MVKESLLNKDSIGIFGFGTTISSYPSKYYDYLSNSNDVLLNRLRFNPIAINSTDLITILIDPLKANFDIPISSEDLSGHSLTETYLSSRSKAPQYAKEKILKMAESLDQHQSVIPPIGVFVSFQAVGENGSETPGFWLSTPTGISTGRPLSRDGQGPHLYCPDVKEGEYTFLSSGRIYQTGGVPDPKEYLATLKITLPKTSKNSLDTRLVETSGIPTSPPPNLSPILGFKVEYDRSVNKKIIEVVEYFINDF